MPPGCASSFGSMTAQAAGGEPPPSAGVACDPGAKPNFGFNSPQTSGVTNLHLRPHKLRTALTQPGMVPAPYSVEDGTMTQYSIKVLNYPDPPADGEIVSRAARAPSGAAVGPRCGGERHRGNASAEGPPDPAGTLTQARDRQIHSPDGCDAIEGLAGICADRVADLANPGGPETRRRALLLHDMEEEIRGLATLIAEVLDSRARSRCATVSARTAPTGLSERPHWLASASHSGEGGNPGHQALALVVVSDRLRLPAPAIASSARRHRMLLSLSNVRSDR
jgi:hypothetical protein